MIGNILLLLFGIPLFLLVLHFLGLFMPKRWWVQCSHSYFLPEQKMASLLTDVPNFPKWKQLDRSEWINTLQLEWKEWYGGHSIQFKAYPEDEGHLIHQLSMRNSAKFAVNRTYKIWRQDHMTFLKVEDELIIAQPAMRILSRLFYNHAAFLKKEMQQLDAYLQMH